MPRPLGVWHAGAPLPAECFRKYLPGELMVTLPTWSRMPVPLVAGKPVFGVEAASHWSRASRAWLKTFSSNSGNADV